MQILNVRVFKSCVRSWNRPKGCHQRTGIAAGGEFIERPARTAAWFCNIVDVKNYCLALFVCRNRS